MESNPHILIVDDDNRICKLLKQFFIREGFQASTAYNVAEAEKMLSYFIFDLIILDVMLPGVTGLDFAKTLKGQGDNIPVILLTALGEAEHRISGLEAGADDYLVKPIEPRELLLRAKNLIDLYGQTRKTNLIHFGNNVFDLNSKELKRNSELVHLTTTEIKLLEMFIDKVGDSVSREELASFMGGLNERSVDVNIVRLRSKIEDDPKNPRHLQTVRNEGYVFYL
ncbi:MAG: ompR [Rickettsiaceae bacterium]|jgi:two-component system phosphate regulon response regulator OmpR|nr:ompR [Rickettsiaceae bacterium]